MHESVGRGRGGRRRPDVAVVILTGADPAFSAGVDLKEVSGEVPPSATPRPSGQGPERDTNGLYRFLPVIDKPVIGAINGVAVTGGLEIALQCTFLVASDRARFADTHGRVGIMPGGGIPSCWHATSAGAVRSSCPSPETS